MESSCAIPGVYETAIAGITEPDYRAVLQVNLGATLFVTQAVVGKLQAAGQGGSIINVSSQMGHVGGPNRAVYAASKHAVEGLTKALAIELSVESFFINPTIARLMDAIGEGGSARPAEEAALPLRSDRSWAPLAA